MCEHVHRIWSKLIEKINLSKDFFVCEADQDNPTGMEPRNLSGMRAEIGGLGSVAGRRLGWSLREMEVRGF